MRGWRLSGPAPSRAAEATYTPAAMKRLLLLLLTLLLPLQFSWAALSPYCGDEHETAAAHALHDDQGGHHHADVADAADADEGEDAADCGHCHGHLTPLPTGDAQPARQPLAAPWVPDSAAATAARPGPRPERPQWATLA